MFCILVNRHDSLNVMLIFGFDYNLEYLNDDFKPQEFTTILINGINCITGLKARYGIVNCPTQTYKIYPNCKITFRKFNFIRSSNQN